MKTCRFCLTTFETPIKCVVYCSAECRRKGRNKRITQWQQRSGYIYRYRRTEKAQRRRRESAKKWRLANPEKYELSKKRGVERERSRRRKPFQCVQCGLTFIRTFGRLTCGKECSRRWKKAAAVRRSQNVRAKATAQRNGQKYRQRHRELIKTRKREDYRVKRRALELKLVRRIAACRS